ncbi:NAD(P)-dependent alcohol dehydrogenase [Alteromonas sp. C1M14]|uniref:zinc-dependent alcohol dehydrogenase family protein n=1 Tax=Alteromonas sp. C1M14 TaxID=2841567 RepID=UPI001C084FCD|nr:NAD(P)-dependent alcohol dehydrogenase [Alteromonas sp. C1M14]MBU2979258.1 NAD(P)-dependent alcohol dehydrogenase [Alteromonas sp. C1M14]
MKAVVLKKPGGLDQIALCERDETVPGPTEIKVAIKASSLNYHDLLVAQGHMPTETDRILMSDGAGIVEQVGEEVTEFAVGDAVVSTFFPQWLNGPATTPVGNFAQTPGDGVDGMAAEYVVRSTSAFTHAPKGWRHEESATITTAGLTAWRALVVDGKIKAGDTILTLGTGGVSLAALQIGKLMGAKVIITSSSDDKLSKAKALGADVTINYRTTPNWAEAVLAATHGKGVDHVIELGGPNTLNQSIEAVRVGGHISLIGVLTGFQGDIATASIMAKQVRLQGLIVGSKQDQMEYIKALNASDIRPIIDKTFAFDALAEAFDYQQSGSHFGKICLTW